MNRGDQDYVSENILCDEGFIEGFKDCGSSLPAKYILLVATVGGSNLMVGELLAWDAPMIELDQSVATGMTLTGMALYSGWLPNGSPPMMFGSDPSETDRGLCPSFTASTNPASMSFVLPDNSQVDSLLM